MPHVLLTLLMMTGSPRANAIEPQSEVIRLRNQVAALTAEADALWAYVESGPDNPNVRAMRSALALWKKRQQARRR